MALDVIGAGFGRTGTMTLRDALNRLGFGPCYHMSEVINNPHFASYWATLARGGRMDWEEVFASYHSTVDWPGCTYWRELMQQWPQAKVILSVRDPHRWHQSVLNTIFSDAHVARFEGPDAHPDFQAMVRRLNQQTFDNRSQDEEYAISIYQAHNEAVMREVPPEKLLVFNPAEGWEPLCQFLGVAVPDEEFPRVNSTKEWQERPRRQIKG